MSRVRIVFEMEPTSEYDATKWAELVIDACRLESACLSIIEVKTMPPMWARDRQADESGERAA